MKEIYFRTSTRKGVFPKIFPMTGAEYLGREFGYDRLRIYGEDRDRVMINFYTTMRALKDMGIRVFVLTPIEDERKKEILVRNFDNFKDLLLEEELCTF